MVILLIFLPAFWVGWQKGYSLQEMGRAFYYYAKSLIFFLFGIHSVWFFKNSRPFKLLLFYLITGTLIFYLFPNFFIGAAHDKSHIGNGWGHFLSFSFFLRSGSFLLSPLETAFFSSFLGLYFFYNRKKLALGFDYFILASVGLILSMTRSVILGYFLCICFMFLAERVKINLPSWFRFIPFAIGLLVVLAGWFSRDLLIKNDGSIMLHFENLIRTLMNLKAHPFGYGMSSSGYVAVVENRDSLYSEGSFFTLLIECGIQGLLLIFILIRYCLNKSLFTKTLLLFFLGISLVLPIGFSTPFCFLFFGTLGSLSRLNENHYSDHKL